MTCAVRGGLLLPSLAQGPPVLAQAPLGADQRSVDMQNDVQPGGPERPSGDRNRKGPAWGACGVQKDSNGQTRLNGSKLSGSPACIPAESRIASWCEGDC